MSTGFDQERRDWRDILPEISGVDPEGEADSGTDIIYLEERDPNPGETKHLAGSLGKSDSDPKLKDAVIVGLLRWAIEYLLTFPNKHTAWATQQLQRMQRMSVQETLTDTELQPYIWRARAAYEKAMGVSRAPAQKIPSVA